ncbi:unnamed protein product [Cladocopium goreaui]|uniref:Uncharacterized protein n=1 Tax=Cladocopium goreaui TaxID=2562237 RepID=A0A9P1FZR0_9DINO|nr:unnamed protein product [Cladocopium goreaui]
MAAGAAVAVVRRRQQEQQRKDSYQATQLQQQLENAPMLLVTVQVRHGALSSELKSSSLQVQLHSGKTCLLSTKASEPLQPRWYRSFRGVNGASPLFASPDGEGLRIDFDAIVQYPYTGQKELVFDLLERRLLWLPKVVGRGVLHFSELSQDLGPLTRCSEPVLREVYLYTASKELVGVLGLELRFETTTVQGAAQRGLLSNALNEMAS